MTREEAYALYIQYNFNFLISVEDVTDKRREMNLTEEILENKIRTALPVVHIKAVDQSAGCGSKFEILIVSA